MARKMGVLVQLKEGLLAVVVQAREEGKARKPGRKDLRSVDFFS